MDGPGEGKKCDNNMTRKKKQSGKEIIDSRCLDSQEITAINWEKCSCANIFSLLYNLDFHECQPFWM